MISTGISLTGRQLVLVLRRCVPWMYMPSSPPLAVRGMLSFVTSAGGMVTVFSPPSPRFGTTMATTTASASAVLVPAVLLAFARPCGRSLLALLQLLFPMPAVPPHRRGSNCRFCKAMKQGPRFLRVEDGWCTRSLEARHLSVLEPTQATLLLHPGHVVPRPMVSPR